MEKQNKTNEVVYDMKQWFWKNFLNYIRSLHIFTVLLYLLPSIHIVFGLIHCR